MTHRPRYLQLGYTDEIQTLAYALETYLSMLDIEPADPALQREFERACLLQNRVGELLDNARLMERSLQAAWDE